MWTPQKSFHEKVRFGRVGKSCHSNLAEVSDALRSALLESISVILTKLPPGSFPIAPSIFHETYILPYRPFQLTKVAGTPVDIKHSGFKSLTAFLKASAKEGLVKIKETKGGVVITGMSQLCFVKGWLNEDPNTGVDGSHPSIQAHVRHVTVKEAEEYNEKQKETQDQGMGKFQENRHEQQVTLLRKPSPVSAAFFQCIGKE